MAHKKLNIAINGFGRIGRAAFKIALDRPELQIVAINDLTDADTLAHLLKYDTVYGRFDKPVSSGTGFIQVGQQKVDVLSEKDPQKLPWQDKQVDVVLECTGVFRTRQAAEQHITAGAKKVIISAPSKGGDVGTYVLGVNDDKYQADETVIDNASCTTNCVAPVAQVIHSAFGVQKASLTTIHSYTADQNLQDGPHKDLGRARAAAQNIVPTTTGAAKATTQTIPELAGLFDGLAVRVPTICGSLSDFTFVVEKKTSVEEVNQALEKAAQSDRLKGILEVTQDRLVSSDIIGTTASAIVDLGMTQVVDGDLIKIIAWYDNEWGYANRLVDMVSKVSV